MLQLNKLIAALSLVAATAMPFAAHAAPGCVGKMWNPLTDLDFRNMGGIKIAGFALMKAPNKLGEPPKHKADPVCFCANGLQTGYGLGVTFWMPSYINDMARQAGCLGFLSGVNILPGFISLSSGQEYNFHSARKDGITNMQVHWVYADVAAIAGKALFEKCNAMTGNMKIGYLTEPDFIFQNDVYSAIMTPQVSLLAEAPILSQMSCGFESIANTLGDWRDFGICAWKGTRMPLTANAIAKDSAQVSNMDVTIKYLTRSALLGLTMRTMGDDAVCKPKYSAFYEPFQHRYQWSFPGKVTTRYNVDVIRWGMFIKDDGQGGMLNLNSQATQLASVDSTTAVGSAAPSANNVSVAEGIVSRLPKPLNFPSREAGYMQVWEARQCCMMVFTIENVITMIIQQIATAGTGPLAELYKFYQVASKVYQAVTDPVGAILGVVGDAIGSALGTVAEGMSSAVGDFFSTGADAAASGIGSSFGQGAGDLLGKTLASAESVTPMAEALVRAPDATGAVMHVANLLDGASSPQGALFGEVAFAMLAHQD